MRVVIAGGSGQVGQILARAWTARGHDVVILGRGSEVACGRLVRWDAVTLDASWGSEIDGADVVVNLAGRSVNCRYTQANQDAMMGSRVDATRVVGEAIAAAARPPALWLQMSTATIYAHTFDSPNDEHGVIGGEEPDVPRAWDFSVKIAQAWEQALADANTPGTRKVVLRTSMVMSPDEDGIFDTLMGLVRKGLGGTNADGRQYMSWIHEADFVAALDHLIAREDLMGVFNLAAPGPVPNEAFMRSLREASGTRVGLPAARWMLSIGAVFMRTETELVLKSRRVISRRLPESGFTFRYPTWDEACRELLDRTARRAA